MNAKYKIFALLFFLSTLSWAQKDDKLTLSEITTHGGINFKCMPALYWNSIGIEAELPIKDVLTIGVNVIGKYGRSDGGKVIFKIRPEESYEAAYRVEFAAKYYISHTAPEGIYIQFNASYGTLLYYDGTNRPFTLHSKWKNFDPSNLRDDVDFVKPNPFSFGGGVGYQLVMIPKKIIGNIMIGTQGYFSKEEAIYPAIYVSPSLGFAF